MSFYNEILPNLFLGTIEASRDREFIYSNNISVIVNCSKDILDTYGLNLLKPIEEAPKEVQEWLYKNSYYIKYYRVPVDDSGKEKDISEFYKYTFDLLPKIKNDYDLQKKILVHCQAGVQRSASFVCAFIMYIHRVNLQRSINYVLEKKPNVFFFGTQNNFINALVNIENDIENNLI